MGIQQLQRDTYSVSLTIESGGDLSEAFDFRLFGGGDVSMPAAWTAASIGFQVSNSLGGTFQPKYDENNSLIEISGPIADRTYSVPVRLFGSHFIKLWSQTNGSGVNQASDRVLRFDLKG